MSMSPLHQDRQAVPRSVMVLGGLVVILMVFAASRPAFPQAQQAPPESKEIQAALKLVDLHARIKELERIKAAFPESRLMDSIDRSLLAAKVDLCETVDEVDTIQRPLLSQGAGFARLDSFYYACDRILRHRNLGRFNKSRVTAIIETYFDAYAKAVADPAVIKDIPEDQRKYIASYTGSMYIFLAQAYAGEARTDRLVATLDAYQKAGGPPDASFYFYRGEARALQGKDAEAYEDYFTAAVDNYRDSEAKARTLFRKLHRTDEGFAAALEAKWRGLPFHPEPFAVPAGWSGKAVLAELFTGSECPPCVAADLGFDGLLEAIDSKQLVVLEYHLPIPGPDPFMTPASKTRQDFYGVRSTPTPFFDGERKFPGGGSRTRAEEKFKEFRGEIESRVAGAPLVDLKVEAVRRGGEIRVSCSFDKVLPGADYTVALVEKEGRYRGSNGIVFHKMIVRDLLALAPAAKTHSGAFDLAKIERALIKYLEDYEKEKGFQFKEKRAAIDASKLAVVAFAQDKASKRVWNAVLADVK